MTRSLRRMLALLPALALLLAVAACSDDDSSETSTTDDSAPAEQASGELEVSDVWARATADGQDAGAAYLVITGGAEDDALVGASVPSDVAGVVELHETVPAEDGEDAMDGMGESTDDSMGDMGSEGDDEMSGMGEDGDEMSGMAEGMTMQPVPEIDVPAGEEVVLEPGGYHVMLLELAGPLEVGDTFDLTLTFEQAGEMTMPVEVRER